MPEDNGHASPSAPAPARWQVVIVMNEHGQVHVAQSTPSTDVTHMLLARALAFIERELLVARMRQEEPRIRPATTLPPRIL